MSNFSYNQYQEVIARAQNGANGSAQKIGFFKLKNDGDEALVRFNVKSLDDLQFATVHQLGAAQKWMKVSCLNPVGSYAESCPLCAAVAGGAKDIGKASKKVYVQMIVSYKDAATGQFAAAIPVIWERPAGFSREIANLLKDYGDLSTRVFKITRNGAANSMQTTYPISYIPLYDKPESVSNDFGAFANFNIAKHSFWEKSLGDINVFLNTGVFPEVVRPPQTPTPTDADAPAYTKPVYQPPVTTESYAPVTPTAPAYLAPEQPAAQNQYVPPVAPQYQAPVAPNFVNSTPMSAAVPTTPEFVQPAAPQYQAPATPDFTNPAFANPDPTVNPVDAATGVTSKTSNTSTTGTDFGRAPRAFNGISF